MKDEDIIRAIDTIRSEMSAQLSSISTQIGEIKTHTAVTADAVQRHDGSLYGQNGLSRRMDIVETRQIECPARSGSKAIRAAFISAIVSAIVTGIIGAAILTATHSTQATANPRQTQSK